MAAFRVLKPCAVVHGGKVTHFTVRNVGHVYELAERDAKQFVEDGSLEPASATAAAKDAKAQKVGAESEAKPA